MLTGWTTALGLRLRMLFRRKQLEQDLEDELAFHLAMKASKAGTREQARREFGNVTSFREACRELWSLGRVEVWWQDIRYGLRGMRQNPGFTAAGVLVLALGIGANAAIFSLLNAVLFRTLPVRQPERLFFLDNAGAKGATNAPPYPCFERFRLHAKSFEGMAAYATIVYLIRIDGRLERIQASRVSGSYYSVLGLEPFAGRLLNPVDEKLDPPAAVINYEYWQGRFGGRPEAIGKHFVLNDRVFTIVGVTPPGYHGLIPGERDDIMVPVTISGPRQLSNTNAWWFRAIARLKPGILPDQVRAEIDPIFKTFMSEIQSSPDSRRDYFHHMVLTPASHGVDALRERFSRPLWALMAVVGLVLLIACANITNLLLARAAGREREFAVRVAIGAGRGRLLRQLLLEAGLLFAAGAGAGVMVAIWLARGLTAFFAGGARPILLDAQWDWRVLGFTAGLALVATLISGAAPIWRAVWTDPHSAMRGGSRQTASSGRSKLGHLLVAFQVALSVVLLVGASLFLRTLRNLHAVDAGFRAGQVTIMSLQMLPSTYDRPVPHPVRIAAWDRLLTGVRALPGVQTAGLSTMTPLDGSGRGIYLDAPGYLRRSDEDGRISLNTVSEDYFTTLGTRIVRGRDFSQSDRLGAPPVALLNQSAVEHFFAGRDPIGTIVKPNEYSYQIVGIVADAKHQGLRQQAGRFIYVPFRQPMDRGLSMTLSIQASSGTGPLVAAVQRLVRDTGPDIVVSRTDTLARQVDESLLTERIVSLLAAAFGALALALSAIGLYGVLAYSVARQSTEIGVRMALGAKPGKIAWGVLRQTLGLVAAGLAAGIPASVLLARLGETLLYGVTPSDTLTHAGVAVLLLCVSVAAALIPALRASRIAPATALRGE